MKYNDQFLVQVIFIGLFASMKICTYCIIFFSDIHLFLTLGLFLSRRASFSTIDELNVSNPVRTPMHKSAEVARTRSFAMRISKLVVIIVSNPLYTTYLRFCSSFVSCQKKDYPSTNPRIIKKNKSFHQDQRSGCSKPGRKDRLHRQVIDLLQFQYL